MHGWYSGLVFGMLPNRTPDALFGLEGFGLGYTVRQDNGAFASFWKEVGFYKDLKTNQVIETWENPYTGETNRVMHIHNRMVKGVFGPHFRIGAPVGAQTGRMDFKFPNYRASDDPTNPFVLNWQTIEKQTSVWLDFRAEVPNLLDPKVWVKESTGERLPVCEMFEYVCDADELRDPSLDRVKHNGSWIRLAPWLPWMMMGQHEGRLFYRCTTKSLSDLSEVPPNIAAYAEKNYAEYLVEELNEDHAERVVLRGLHEGERAGLDVTRMARPGNEGVSPSPGNEGIPALVEGETPSFPGEGCSLFQRLFGGGFGGA